MGMGCWDQAEAIAAPRTLSSSSSSLVAKSCPTLVTPKTVACQTPPSMGLSRQEYWSGLPFPSAEDLPNPGIKLGSPALPADFYQLSYQGSLKILHGGGGLFAQSCLTLATPWTVACQTPLSMGFSRQKYWSGLPFPSPCLE